MILLNLQMFAKGGSGGDGIGADKSKPVDKRTFGSSTGSSHGGGSGKGTSNEKGTAASTRTKGESVTAVSKHETYEIYAIKNEKVIYVKDRQGSVILEKMRYDSQRKVWISRSKGNRYTVRKKNR